MRTEYQIKKLFLQGVVGTTPLSAHEHVQAKALLEKYCDACEMKFFMDFPFWARQAARTFYVAKRDDLEKNIKEGNFWLVRAEIECPERCPQDEPEGRKL